MASEFERIIRSRQKIMIFYTIGLILLCISMILRFFPDKFGIEDFDEVPFSIISIAISIFSIIASLLLLLNYRKIKSNPKWNAMLLDELFYNIRYKSAVVGLITVLVWQLILLPLAPALEWAPGLCVLTTFLWAIIGFFGTFVFLSRD